MLESEFVGAFLYLDQDNHRQWHIDEDVLDFWIAVCYSPETHPHLVVLEGDAESNPLLYTKTTSEGFKTDLETVKSITDSLLALCRPRYSTLPDSNKTIDFTKPIPPNITPFVVIGYIALRAYLRHQSSIKFDRELGTTFNLVRNCVEAKTENLIICKMSEKEMARKAKELERSKAKKARRAERAAAAAASAVASAAAASTTSQAAEDATIVEETAEEVAEFVEAPSTHEDVATTNDVNDNLATTTMPASRMATDYPQAAMELATQALYSHGARVPPGLSHQMGVDIRGRPAATEYGAAEGTDSNNNHNAAATTNNAVGDAAAEAAAAASAQRARELRAERVAAASRRRARQQLADQIGEVLSSASSISDPAARRAALARAHQRILRSETLAAARGEQPLRETARRGAGGFSIGTMPGYLGALEAMQVQGLRGGHSGGRVGGGRGRGGRAGGGHGGASA